MHHCLIFGNVSDPSLIHRTSGIYRISHYLRSLGWDSESVDYFNYWTLFELQEFCKSRITKNTKFIGISHLFIYDKISKHLYLFCKWFKTQYPHIHIISGSMSYPRIDCKYIDYQISGYGEYALEVLIKWLYSNGKKPKFDNNIINAIDNYPAFPMKSLYTKYEDRDYLKPHEWLGIETTRGCIFKCSFCNFPVLGVKEDHSRSAADFKYHIEDTYNKYGITQYYVTDETFNDRADKVAAYANVIDQLNFQPWFVGYIRIDLTISRALTELDQLKRMGFIGHFYGIETFNHAAGKSIGKGMHPDKIKQGLLDIKNHFGKKYRGTIGLIAGLPHETNQSLDEMETWLLNNWKGESVRYSPLYLTETRKDSILAENYEKYGYTKINQPVEDMKFVSRKKSDVMKTQPIIWENEHMSFFDADQRTHNFKKNKVFNETAYGLIQEDASFFELEDKLTLTHEEFRDKNNIEYIVNHGHVYQYIQSKLTNG